MATKGIIITNESEITRAEVIDAAKQHYEIMTEIPLDWKSIIFEALEAWEREPMLLQRIIDAEDRIVYLEEEFVK